MQVLQGALGLITTLCVADIQLNLISLQVKTTLQIPALPAPVTA